MPFPWARPPSVLCKIVLNSCKDDPNITFRYGCCCDLEVLSSVVVVRASVRPSIRRPLSVVRRLSWSVGREGALHFDGTGNKQKGVESLLFPTHIRSSRMSCNAQGTCTNRTRISLAPVPHAYRHNKHNVHHIIWHRILSIWQCPFCLLNRSQSAWMLC